MVNEDPNKDYLDNYIAMVPLFGEALNADNSKVHTYIIHFIAGNSVAEAKIIAYGQINGGRADYFAFKEHFEDIGVHSLEITKAENIINSLYYAGEKKPHM